MRMVDLIENKKRGQALTNEEIDWMISGYVQGDIPDYQMSAMLMAICFRGMTDRETLDSKAMRKDFPRLYDQYVKMTPVKSSIRVKIKEGA